MTEKIEKILKRTEHTLLDPLATEEEIKTLCHEAAVLGVAAVCVPSCYVETAVKSLTIVGLSKKLCEVCTVVGFPNGNCSVKAKVEEAMQAVEDGADEINMVINLGKLKNKDYLYISNEIREVRRGLNKKAHKMGKRVNPVLKVIIESGLQNDTTIENLCTICSLAGADFVTTSTAFSNYGGTTLTDAMLMVKCASELNEKYGTKLRVEASGGIVGTNNANEFLEAKVDRLGSGRIALLAIREEYNTIINNDDNYINLCYDSDDGDFRATITPDMDELLRDFVLVDSPLRWTDLIGNGRYIFSIRSSHKPHEVISIAVVYPYEASIMYVSNEIKSPSLSKSRKVDLWFSEKVSNGERDEVHSFIKCWAKAKKLVIVPDALERLNSWTNV